MKIKAALFDLDGVLVDTARYHYEAWLVLANQLSIPFTEKENEQLKGISRTESLERLLSFGKMEQKFSEKEKSAFAEQKQSISSSDSKMDETSVLPGAIAVLEYLKNKHQDRIGISKQKCTPHFRKTNLTSYFDVLIDGTQVSKAKPDPEVFLKGAQQLNVPPNACLVIEDSEAGCQAALAGNMHVLGIGENINLPSAEYVIPDLTVFDQVRSFWHLSEAVSRI